MLEHLFDGFKLIHAVLLVSAAVASFRFWVRTRFWFPRYVHVLAAIGFAVMLMVFWAMPEESRKNTSAARLLVAALVLPAIVYFFFVVYGGPRAAFYGSFKDSAPCPFCQSPVRTLPNQVDNQPGAPKFAEPACPACGHELT
jgi:hypothetical protein